MCTDAFILIFRLTSIRLVGFMALPDPERHCLSLKDFLLSIGWFLYPVSKNPDPPRPIPQRLLHCAKILSYGVAKVFIVDFARRWLLQSSSMRSRYYFLLPDSSSSLNSNFFGCWRWRRDLPSLLAIASILCYVLRNGTQW